MIDDPTPDPTSSDPLPRVSLDEDMPQLMDAALYRERVSSLPGPAYPSLPISSGLREDETTNTSTPLPMVMPHENEVELKPTNVLPQPDDQLPPKPPPPPPPTVVEQPAPAVIVQPVPGKTSTAAMVGWSIVALFIMATLGGATYLAFGR